MLKLNKVKLGIGLRTWYVSNSARYNRGLNYYNIVKQPLIAFTALKLLNLPYWVLLALVPFWFVGWWGIGWIDQHKAKIWQEESAWGANQVSPWNIEVLERIKKIEEKLNEQKK